MTCPKIDCEVPCPACRGRTVISRLYGGDLNLLLNASPNSKLDLDASKFFDRDHLADELAKEFGLLVEVEEIPNTLGLMDKFCERVVTELIKRDPKKVYIYCA